MKKTVLTLATLSILFACNDGPKVISAKEKEVSKTASNIFSEENTNTETTHNHTTEPNESVSDGIHKVTVKEVLPTTKYVYLNVSENGETFWIATAKQPIEVGKTYFYRGGLLKTNFESKEHNRVFDRMILINNLVPEDHAMHTNMQGQGDVTRSQTTPVKEDIEMHGEKISQQKGSMSIADLLKEPNRYEGKVVQLSGKVAKVNPNIMNRNWIHLQDGTQDDFDMVLTSKQFVQEGETVTMKGTVVLNRDFGAGYTYDLIIENAEVVK
ncbi:hypothetical protein [Luteirhabdus pelagi]|uniref:hypothetical protein n=1 Tax=Luteirhabdus pelagi TaxID=2792783 RepID=UPI00193A16DC|nr:hypothetical protein [Luteirhabdus pelagi]